jgi:DNA-binding transcriptional LysR family regulator
MELRTLEYFLAVAREENMTAAADVLHVTQPTLSRQIADLERELGVTLFIRSNRATTLTEDGMRLRQRAEEIVGLAERCEAEFRLPDEDLAGTVAIGAGETVMMRRVARVAQRIHARHPLVHFDLYSGNADDVAEKLEHGTLDLGLMLEPVDKARYEYLTLPDRDTVGVLMRADDPLAQEDAITPEQLARMPLLHSSRDVAHNFDLRTWSKNRIDPDQIDFVGTYNLIFNAGLFVEAGVGYSLTLEGLSDVSETSGLRFVPLRPRLTMGGVIVWKKYRLPSHAAEVFLDELHADLEGEEIAS